MEFDESSSQFASFIQQHKLSLLLGVIALLFFGYGLITLLSLSSKSSSEIIFESQQTQKAPSSLPQLTPVQEIMVDVAGAVSKPGVYKLPHNSRVQDALLAAGGMAETADNHIVSKTLNLAAKLIDGAKLYIPQKGEKSGEDMTSISVLGESTKLININTATSEVLDTLPGVGKVTAEKIILQRPYAVLEELVSKKAVSQSVFTKIKEMITLY